MYHGASFHNTMHAPYENQFVGPEGSPFMGRSNAPHRASRTLKAFRWDRLSSALQLWFSVNECKKTMTHTTNCLLVEAAFVFSQFALKTSKELVAMTLLTAAFIATTMAQEKFKRAA